MKLIVIAAATIALAACHAIPNGACPVLIKYDAEFNEHLANEVANLPADSAALRAVRDYIALRDQVRACLASD